MYWIKDLKQTLLFSTNNKSAADDLENLVAKTWKISINDSLIVKKAENIVAKGEIAHHEQFHLWPQLFQKSSAAIASAGGKGLIK